MLKLSAKGDYGLMFLKHISELPAGQFVTVREAAQARHLPVKYLERMAAALVTAGILVSREGQGGGYALVRNAQKIKLVDVLAVLEGELESVRCTHNGKCCDRQAACERKTGWQKIHSKLYNVLSQYSLADILTSINN